MIIGLIIDKNTKRPIRDAYIHVYGIDKNITSTGTCLFWASGEHINQRSIIFFFLQKEENTGVCWVLADTQSSLSQKGNANWVEIG